METKLLIHPLTKKNIDLFLNAPAHALLLSGLKGSGKSTLARFIAIKLLETTDEKIDINPYFFLITKPQDKKNIGIDAIRAINKATSLQVAGTNKVRRIFLIEDAHHMNREAQNALLKVLEEPPADTVFILTTEKVDSLLPTVVSRLTRIKVQPVTLEDSKAHFSEDEATIRAAWQLSQGAAGLLASLLSEETSELKEAVSTAKSILGKDKYQRLLIFDQLSRNKQEFLLVLDGLTRVIQALYRSYATKENSASALTRLSRSMRLILDSQDALEQNVLPRLVALRLALSLSV